MPEYDEIDDEIEPISSNLVVAAGTSDKQIEKYFETGRLRVVQEKNDIFLSHVMNFISGSGSSLWGNLRPEYQRRLRWDNKKKSKLIESFIMNVPVPPVFLYEKELGIFEVMDGQQRLNAISDFFTGGFALEGLEIWPALNGRNYQALPPLVRRGLERAKISAITLMSDNSAPKEDSLDLRAQVFERLNTGGERLNPQELRNSLYSGGFNSLLIELSKLREFTDAWEIPNHDSHTRADGTPSAELAANTLFKRMMDVEIVLRFFAFRHPAHVAGSVRSMLDGTMKRLRNSPETELASFRADFIEALKLCHEVLGDNAFRLPPTDGKIGKLSRPLYDAQMIGMFNLREHKDILIKNKSDISNLIFLMSAPSAETYDLLVGRGNTAKTIRSRLDLVESAIRAKINV